jgi:hypothetical protein
MATITITRTPDKTIDIETLSIGMKVVNQDGDIGTIAHLNYDKYPQIGVVYNNYYGWINGYHDSGYHYMIDNIDELADLVEHIELVDSPYNTSSSIAEKVKAHVLTEKEKSNLSKLMTKFGMSRENAIAVVIE